MSTSSVNVQFVPGEGRVAAIWTVKRQDESFGCEVSNRAHLKDCTAYRIPQESSELHLGGYAHSTTWFSKIVHVTLLPFDREFRTNISRRTYKTLQTYPLFHSAATEGLILLFRSSTKMFVKFIPTYGATGYTILARSTQYGVLESDCDSTTYICYISGLTPASLYVLWLRTCHRKGYRFCELRAIPLEVYTLPDGKRHRDIKRLHERLYHLPILKHFSTIKRERYF